MSNRLTFSLASLVLLIAFGLVFAPVSVMAHEPGDTDTVFKLHHDGLGSDANTAGTGTADQLTGGALQTEKGHTHLARPTVTSIELVDFKVGTGTSKKSTTKGSVVTLVNDVTATSPVAADGSASGEFQLKVVFDKPVYNDSGQDGDDQTTTFADTDVVASDFLVRAAVENTTTNIFGANNVSISDDECVRAPDDDDTTDDESQFTLLITIVVDASRFGGQAGDTSALPIDVWFTVRENNYYTQDNALVDGNIYRASANAASSQKKFTIVSAFDETGPTADVTAASKFNKSDEAVFTVDFNEPLATSGDGALAVGDFTIVNGLTSELDGPTEAENDDDKTVYRYTLTVTPKDPYEGVKVTLKKDSVTDSMKNSGPSKDAASDAIVEDIKPAVVVSAAAALNKDDKAVFTLKFSETLSSSGFDAFGLNDLSIDGGTAAAADLSKPTDGTDTDDLQADKIYTLLVTPNTDLMDGELVTVTVGSQIKDAAGNAIDLTRGTPSKSLAVDLNPPTVTITAPAAPLTTPTADAGKLEFTFLFSEPINDFTSEDIIGEDYIVTDAPTKDATHTPATGTNTELWTAKVTPTDEDSVTVVLNVGAVSDLVGRKLAAGAFATYSPPVTNTPPVFEAWENPGLTWCEGVTLGDTEVLLPKARDSENDSLTYTLTGGGDISDADRANPVETPDMGLYWVTIDSETRYLRGYTAVGDAGTYTWTVTDQHGATNVTPLTFTITVDPYEEPNAVTGVMATKVDARAKVGDDVDKVKLTWTDPNPTTYPNTDCIPAVTHYIISRQALNTHTQGRTAKGAVETTTLTVAEATNDDGNLEYITDKLDHGTYEFTVQARNQVTRPDKTTYTGTSDASDEAVWDRTDHHWVIVNDPPVASTNLRANQTDTPRHSVTLDWIPPTHNPDAPVDDTATGLAEALYGVAATFGGYHVEVTDQDDGSITIYPMDDTLISGNQRTYHIAGLQPGEYTCRVVAWNVVGEGDLSNSQAFEIDVYQPPDPSPTNKPPVFESGAKIDNIVATAGQAIAGRFLPVATDADGDALTYSITETLPAGLNFDATTRALTGTPTAEMAETAYTYKVEDTATPKGSDTIGFFITVNAATQPPTGPTPATTIASKGYAVFVPANHDASALPNGLVPHTVANMPDLIGHFRAGGTIDVIVTGKANHNVIITEIMVATDLGRVGQSGTMRPEAGQWIELYNNTAAAINVSDITLMFTTGYPAPAAPANATDRISNTVAPGWGFDATFVEAASGQTAVNASGVVTVPKMFKSLRRKYKDDKKLQDAGTVIENGWNTSSWTLTADTKVFLAGRVGTPGSENRPSTFSPAVFTAPQMEMTFNEIANRSDNSNEWIELKGAAGATLRKHKISVVTAYDKATNKGTETTIYQFPDNDDVKIPSNGILLITDQNPANNELAADLENGVPKEGIRYRIRTLAPLPNDGNFLLVLRDKDGNIEDVAGHGTNLSDDNPYTTLWPLAGNVGRISAKNKLEADKVYRRARTIHGYSSNKDNGDEPAFEKMGFTGIGYDRNASVSDMNGGTPGYPNNAYINAGNDATKKVIISEIMYSQDKAGRLAQWIELQNLSATTGVDLHNWRLYIVNHDNADFTGKVLDEVWLRNMKIPPLQTALIVSHTGRNTTNLPSHRVLNLRRKISEPLLSTTGFELRLEAKSNEGDVNKREKGDVVGNLVAFDSKMRRADHQAFADPVWALPSGMDENGDRVSIARRTSTKILMLDGTSEWHWLPSNEDGRSNRMNSLTYYGDANDIGSPGQTVGGVLPVSLSKFRPERQDDGNIVIRWVTESETNNAGFNILRGEALDGEFTKLNTKLIAGQGTTSERTTYTYSDTSAKPNVVYYYQIQDVSLDGQVQTLRTTHLRGNVSAAGKLTTTWGKLKALQ